MNDVFSIRFQDSNDDKSFFWSKMSQLKKNIKANTALEYGRVTMSVLIKAKPQFVNTKPAAFHRFKLLENKT